MGDPRCVATGENSNSYVQCSTGSGMTGLKPLERAMHLEPTLEGEASRDSTEDPDFLLLSRMFRTEVERGGAGGGTPSCGAPPPELPFIEGMED